MEGKGTGQFAWLINCIALGFGGCRIGGDKRTNTRMKSRYGVKQKDCHYGWSYL